MHLAHDFLRALTTVLCVAGITTVIFQRLRQPLVLGYLLAGLIVGPHVSIPLVADRDIIHALSELGVILLMFSLGLEFSMRKLFEVAPTAGLTAIVQSSIMLFLGYLTAQGFGWSPLASVFAGAIVAISSTTIIAKAFDIQRIGGSLRELVVGVLIVEDLIAILLMTALTAMTAGGGLTASVLLQTTTRLGMFLIGLVVVGMLIVPRIIRQARKVDQPETMLVVGIGICFAGALLALEFGYSVALGAFIAGSLVSESGEGQRMEHLVQPVRDVFAAVFFVSVGMLIDPIVVAQNWALVAAFTLLVVVGKILGVSFGAFLSGVGVRTSIRAGMSLAQIGEFSFIIASLGASLKVTGDVLYPVAVAVSAITTLTTPWLIAGSERVARFVDSRLPPALQTFATLYVSWVERMRSQPRPKAESESTRRLYKLLALDALSLAALVIVTSVWVEDIAAYIEARLSLPPPAARVVLGALVIAIAAPLCVGIFRLTHHLGVTLAEGALPALDSGRSDPSLAPRRALVAMLQLSAIVLVALPLIAVTQPFLKGPQSAFAVVFLLGLFGLSVWRSATRLEGHVRAGAQMFMAALDSNPTQQTGKSDVQRLLQGLGEPVAFRLQAGSSAVGRTLADLNLRGQTGATVLAITRRDGGVIIPTAQELLHAGDVLALAGTHEALEQASQLLAAREDTQVSA